MVVKLVLTDFVGDDIGDVGGLYPVLLLLLLPRFLYLSPGTKGTLGL